MPRRRLKYFWDIHVCCRWYGVVARLDALSHLARGHRLHWRDTPEWWIGVTGDIWCEACPDNKGRDVSLWTRNNLVLRWAAMKLCGLLGHPSWNHPTLQDETVANEWCCSRCIAWVTSDTEPASAVQP